MGDKKLITKESEKKVKGRQSFSEKRKIKKEQRYAKWLDPYGIDKMSDEEFEERKFELVGKSVGRVSVGGVLIAIVIILLAMFWDKIFWNAGRWFF